MAQTGRLLTLVICIGLLAGCGGGTDSGGEVPDREPPVVGPDPDPDPARVWRVSGRVQVADYTQIDADTADPSSFIGESFTPRNNSPSQAQLLANPAIVGGFVSGSSGTYPIPPGEETSFPYPADPDDFYRVTILEGQALSLFVFPAADEDPATAPVVTVKLDVSNAVQGGYLVDGAMVSDQFAVSVDTSGDYLVYLQNNGEPATYILAVTDAVDAQAVLPAVQSDARSEFVPGEVILRLNPARTGEIAAARQSLPGYFVQRWDAEGREGLLRLQDDTLQNDLRSLAATPPDELAARRAKTLAAIEQLRQRPDVLLAEPNYIRRASALEDNGLYRYQWNLPQINAQDAWSAGGSGEGAIVAVLDTGVLLDHPDMAGQFLPGYDFISNVATALDGDGLDSDPSDPGDQPSGGSSFHGTHVSGVIAAANNARGTLGVAWGAKIMPLRVLGDGGKGTDADLIGAIRYAAGLPNPSATLPAQRADVINLSLGGPGRSISLEQAVDAAVAAGAIVVAAAGNEASTSTFYPAGYDNTISVSAIGSDQRLAPYSNTGPTIDVTAPGGNLLLDLTGDGYGDGILAAWGADDDPNQPVQFTYSFFQGTSSSTPHVAGVAALMVGQQRSQGRTLTPSAFRTLLEAGALTSRLPDQSAASRNDQFGYGLIDAARALAALGSAPFPQVRAAQATLSFFTREAVANLALDIPAGVTDITGSAIETDGSGWLSLENAGDADPATWVVRIAGPDLEAGVAYSGYIQFDYLTSNGVTTVPRQLAIPVSVTLPGDISGPNAGHHYILMVESDKDAMLANPATFQDSASVENQSYEFDFTVIPEGYWMLVAGSDLDNDGDICDAGEACARYPVLSQPESILVTGDRTDLQFQTGFLERIVESDSTTATSASSARSPLVDPQQGPEGPPKSLRPSPVQPANAAQSGDAAHAVGGPETPPRKAIPLRRVAEPRVLNPADPSSDPVSSASARPEPVNP